MKLVLKALGTESLKLNYDKPPSNFAFKSNLRRCIKALKSAVRQREEQLAAAVAAGADTHSHFSST
jgi:ribosomal protein S20